MSTYANATTLVADDHFEWISPFVCDLPLYCVCPASFLCVTCLNFLCDLPQLFCVTCLIIVCNLPQLFV